MGIRKVQIPDIFSPGCIFAAKRRRVLDKEVVIDMDARGHGPCLPVAQAAYLVVTACAAVILTHRLTIASSCWVILIFIQLLDHSHLPKLGQLT